MKNNIINIIALFLVISAFLACSDTMPEESRHEAGENHGKDEHAGHDNEEGNHGNESGMGEVHLSELKFNSLGIKLDTLPDRVFSGLVSANGQLEVPPQHEATVTAILGANVTDIEVIEGDKVSKGEVLAYVSHPNFTQMQTEYLKSSSRLQYLEKELKRQKRLYEEQVGSGKIYEETTAEYNMVKGEVSGYGAQLKQINLNVDKIKNGEIYQFIPVISPINGYIEKVKVQVGQYTEPQTEMFSIVNTDHIHADLMVFEKDVHKVKKGQDLFFSVESAPGKRLKATIYSVGKQFEQNPKAVHVHAEIKDKEGFLIPGMYINGEIQTENTKVKALPEEAIIEEGGASYIFTASSHEENGEMEWEFKPVEIRKGNTYMGWVEIRLLETLKKGTLVAWNNAYYLISEMKKGETGHEH
ncbi:efflux RND transporter periplasmic adaptor subunit [Membranihabitans maritimus]|uniref:efflux RND transporter periplasmic adaptor subunit n=1 Tax=Membranihabitans maritimus TaxID=2904244 RepID=UPI001F001ED8|nr:efflux RND transporter periplasmic adaptor subunit [Membranihabitans maritimus]